jgi:MFS family permease
MTAPSGRDSAASTARPEGMTAPLRHQTFRRIWLASLLSNLGLLIQGVGAAWIMTQLTSAPDLVALVQTAQMAPVMLFALAAGAIADMFDRRTVALAALGLAFAGSTLLAVVSYLGLITPHLLLALCFMIGSGMAFLWPAWQASVSEQVPPRSLPAAIALNSISYNVARSVGPAIGGMIVAAAGAVAAFGANAVLYLPLMVVLFYWRRTVEPSRLPPEGLARAIVSGVRYVIHSPPIRVALVRTLLTGIIGGALSALMPLVARDHLHGDARTFGMLLGAFGVGAVIGALNVQRARAAASPEMTVRVCTIVVGLATGVVAVSPWALLTAGALMFAGAGWMLAITIFNIGIQFAAPRWVTGRALAIFQASIAGGVAIGSWGWGLVAKGWGVETALLVSGGLLVGLPLLGLWLRLPDAAEQSREAEEVLSEPEVNLALTGRSGPIQLEVEYRIGLDDARAFYQAMQDVQLVRQRNGAYGWSLSRDIADPELWVESFSCPTWLDYLRQRSRATQAERELQNRVWAFHRGDEPVRVRRRLERPFGSVRWKDEVPDAVTGPLPPQPSRI